MAKSLSHSIADRGTATAQQHQECRRLRQFSGPLSIGVGGSVYSCLIPWFQAGALK